MENKRFNAPFSFKGYIDRTEWIISVLLFWLYYYLVVLGVALDEYPKIFMYILVRFIVGLISFKGIYPYMKKMSVGIDLVHMRPVDFYSVPLKLKTTLSGMIISFASLPLERAPEPHCPSSANWCR